MGDLERAARPRVADLRRARLARGLEGRHRRDAAQQPARVRRLRPRCRLSRRGAVLDLPDRLARADRLPGGRCRCHRCDHRELAARPPRRGEGGGRRHRARHRRGRRRGGPDARRVDGGEPRLRPRPDLVGDRARRPADPDLHLGDDGAAEGRSAVAPQPSLARLRRRGDDPAARERRQGDLVAAGRPHRRARRQLLPAGRLRALDHGLPRPAQDHRVPARRQADLVLRRAANLGEGEVGDRGPAREPA